MILEKFIMHAIKVSFKVDKEILGDISVKS